MSADDQLRVSSIRFQEWLKTFVVSKNVFITSVFVDEDQQQDSTTYAPSLQLYPSIYDTSYEAELFPYSNPSIIHDAHAQSDFLTHSVSIIPRTYTIRYLLRFKLL